MMLRGDAAPKVSCSALAASLKRGDRARMSLKGAAASRERQRGQQQQQEQQHRPEGMSHQFSQFETEPPGLSMSPIGPATA